MDAKTMKQLEEELKSHLGRYTESHRILVGMLMSARCLFTKRLADEAMAKKAVHDIARWTLEDLANHSPGITSPAEHCDALIEHVMSRITQEIKQHCKDWKPDASESPEPATTTHSAQPTNN